MKIEKIYSLTDVLNEILDELESGNNYNEFGERQTEYHSLVIAKYDDYNNFYLSVCVTEETHDVDIPWYSIHVIDDINDDYCYITSTDKLSEDELLEKLVEIVHAAIVKNNKKEIMMDNCSDYNMEGRCSRYYDGCFDVANHKTLEDKHIERLYKLLYDLERDGSDDAPALRWAIFTLEQSISQSH